MQHTTDVCKKMLAISHKCIMPSPYENAVTGMWQSRDYGTAEFPEVREILETHYRSP